MCLFCITFYSAPNFEVHLLALLDSDFWWSPKIFVPL